MENSLDRLQLDAGDKDEFYKDPVVVNRGKDTTQEKNQEKWVSAY